MPSETMDFNSLSPSLYSSRDIFSSTERQGGFWKSDNLPKCYDSDQGIKPNLNAQEVSDPSDSREVDIIATQHESSLFSSSLSGLFSRKLRLSANNALYGHSVDNVASHYEEERLFDSLEELEARIIGNLLPSDDDLLSGVADDHGHIIQDSAGDDMDELDLFSSVGGMDLGDDDNSYTGLKNSEILGGAFNSKLGLCNSSIAGEDPTRTLFVRNINSFHTQKSGNSKSMIQHTPSELEQKECDRYLHQKSPPVKSPTSFPGLYGVIKSRSMDGGRILGVKPTIRAPSTNTAFSHEVSSSVPNTVPSPVSLKSVRNQCEVVEFGSSGQWNFGIQDASAFHPHSHPEYHGGLANGVCRNPPVAANINLSTQERIDNRQLSPANSSGDFMEFNECALRSSGNGSCSLPAHHYKWSNSCQPHGMMWPNSPSYFDGIRVAPSVPRLHALPRPPSHMMSTVLPINNQYLPSASLWDQRHAYTAESPDASAFHPGSLGNMQFSSNTAAYCVDFVPHNIFPHFGGSVVDLPILPKNHVLHFHDQRDLIFPGRNHMINSFDTYKQRARSRQNGVSSLADMKQYDLDIDRIRREEDTRTTLMIKNIPNKYTSKMLLSAIDERHKGTYDFVYLPIDFKNKCNVGYAFINMTNPSLIIPFYQVFNGKKWEKFNSEKVASLAYARIQGRGALIAHFQNSSLMNEDKRCRPILFNADGPNAGDQVPFPMGVPVRNKPGRARNNPHEDNL